MHPNNPLCDDSIKRAMVTKHLRYEVEMLRTTTRAHLDFRGDDLVVKNALLESALVHARLLREFLSAKPWAPHKRKNAPQHEDARARDLSPDWEPPLTVSDGPTKDYLDKRIAHLSTRRAESDPTPRIDLNTITTNVFDALRMFLQTLQDTERGLYADVESEVDEFFLEANSRKDEPGTTSTAAPSSVTSIELPKRES